MTRSIGGIYKRGETWWIRYATDGQKYRESSHSTRQGEARRLLQRRIAEINDGRFIGSDCDRLTYSDLDEIIADHYKLMRSHNRARSARKHLRRHLNRFRMRAITADRLTAYRNDRLDEGACPATVQYEFAVLRKGLNLAERANKLHKVPFFPHVTVENTRTGYFEADDLRALLATLPAHHAPWAECAYLTGWRARSEILTREWRHVDFTAGVIRLEPGETKNGEGRTFPFDALPALRALLERQREYTREVERRRGKIVRWVFHNEGRSIGDFYAVWRKACADADLVGKIPHDFRRTAVRNLERSNVSRSVAMKLVGHRTESMYRRYAITNETDLREGVVKLATLNSGTIGAH